MMALAFREGKPDKMAWTIIGRAVRIIAVQGARSVYVRIPLPLFLSKRITVLEQSPL